MTDDEQRDEVERVALTWRSTPYHDCAMVKGAGVDCAMLLRAVYVEAGVMESFEIAHYAPQHFLHQEEERYLGYVTARAREIPLDHVRHGDMALYKIGKVYAHGAIVIKPGWPSIIHAHYAARCVLRGNGTAPHLGTPVLGMRFFSPWGK